MLFLLTGHDLFIGQVDASDALNEKLPSARQLNHDPYSIISIS